MLKKKGKKKEGLLISKKKEIGRSRGEIAS